MKALAETVAEGLRVYVENGVPEVAGIDPAVCGTSVSLGVDAPALVICRDGAVAVRFAARPTARDMRWRDALRDVLREIVPEGVDVK